MAQQTLDNNVLLSEQRAKINNNALDAVSQSDTTTQNLASDLDFAAGKGPQMNGGTVLDQHEKGTFLPTLETSGTAFDAVGYGVQYGKYQIIAGVCSGYGRIRTSSVTKGSASGDIWIGGLPATPAAGVPSYPCIVTRSTGWLVNNPTLANVSVSTSRIILNTRASVSGAETGVDVSDVNTAANTNDIEFWFQYEV